MFADKLVQRAVTELEQYEGKLENQEPLKSRIGIYWDFLNEPSRDGGDGIAWSAAFISYMVHMAGAGDLFRYNGQHSVYFYRTINDLLVRRARPFWGHRVGDVEIQRGDIIGMNRSDGPLIDYDWAAHHADYSSHADIVVEVDGNGVIHTIGGNVGRTPGEIGTKTFSYVQGALKNDAKPQQQAFVVIRSYLP